MEPEQLLSKYDIRKFVAPEFIFGVGARFLAGRYARNYGARKVLVVTDDGVQAAGWTGQIVETLEDFSIPYVIFSQIHSNPRDTEVQMGAEIYRAEDCNLILAVGGGSPMDCAKGIGAVSANGRSVGTFEGVDEVPIPAPPLICIPTTAGSSADVSQFAIISDTSRHVKFAIISKTMVPDVALIDPETTISMDPYLTACTGMDALTHAIEAYVSNASSPMTDLHAAEAIRTVGTALPLVLQHPRNLEYRSQMMLASMYAGLAFSNASLGAVHAMAHALGGLLDMPHGECNALLLDSVIDFNYSSAERRYQRIAGMLGANSADGRAGLLTAVRKLRSTLGIEPGLAARGVAQDRIPTLARYAVKDPCMITNPRKAEQLEVEGIFTNAL